MKNVFSYVFLVSTLVLLTGCAYTLGEPILDYQVEKITPHKTTKFEIFEKFGPPLAVVKRNENVTIPSPPVYRLYGPRPYETYTTQSKNFFELFLGDHALTDYHRIYFYQYYEYKEKLYYWGFGLHVKEESSSNNLWLLINERTGLVEDYKFINKGRGVSKIAPDFFHGK